MEKKENPSKERRPNKLLTANWFMNDEITSALQKYIRRNNFEKALFCAHELVASGFPGKVFNRLFVIIFEDVGFHRLEDFAKLCQIYKEFTKLVGETLNGRMTDVWKHSEMYNKIETILRYLCNGPKTRIASYASAASFLSEDLLVATPIEPLQETWFEELFSCLEVPCKDELKVDLGKYANCLMIGEEMACFYYLNRILLVHDQTIDSAHNSGKKWDTVSELEFSPIKEKDINCVGDLCWVILEVIASRKEETKYLLEYIKLAKIYYLKEKRSPRLCLFSILLAYFRGSQVQIPSVRLDDPTPDWVPLMFEDSNWRDREHVLECRKAFTFDNFVFDKHTTVGKSGGRDTLEYVNKLLEKNEMPRDWFSEEEKARSFRKKDQVPEIQKGMEFFFQEGAKLSEEAKIEDPYKDLAITLYLTIEKGSGTSKAKTKWIAVGYIHNNMQNYDFGKKENKKKRKTTSPKEPKAKKQKTGHSIADFVTLVDLSEEIQSKLKSKDVPKGQRRTGFAKKYVYILPDLVYKGEYDMGEKLVKFAFRSEVFKLLGSKVLLPSGYFKTKSSNIYVAFPNLATSKPEEWKVHMDAESVSMGGDFVRIAERESLGITTCADMVQSKCLKDEIIQPVFLSLLDAFCLGVGDMHLGNTLVANQESWLIDYEDDSHRDLESVKPDDFLFKTVQSAKIREYLSSFLKDSKQVLLDQLEKVKNNVPAILELAKKYGITLDIQKRTEVAQKMLEQL